MAATTVDVTRAVEVSAAGHDEQREAEGHDLHSR
jgi:hypothetical protein